jgi:tetratricopeptide (TPR) repeat protein
VANAVAKPSSQHDLRKSLYNFAAIERARGDLDSALAKFQESLEIARALAETPAEPGSRRDLERSLDAVVRTTKYIAERELAAGNAAAALNHLDSVEPLAEELLQSADADQLNILALYWECRGEAIRVLQRSDLVVECRSRADAIRARIASQFPLKE